MHHVLNGNEAVVEILLALKADPNQKDEYCSLLTTAVIHGAYVAGGIIRSLVKAKANVDEARSEYVKIVQADIEVRPKDFPQSPSNMFDEQLRLASTRESAFAAKPTFT